MEAENENETPKKPRKITGNSSRDNLQPRWKKGESGNPAGYPKGKPHRATIAKKWLAAMEKGQAFDGKEYNLTQEELITIAIITKAKAGDVNAYRELLNSAYGAPKQEIENNVTVTPPLFPDLKHDV